MLNEKEFINSIWDKYYNYSIEKNKNDKFFSHKFYRKSGYILAIKSFMMLSISLFITTGIVYAGVVTYKFVQKSTTTDFNKNYTYDYNQNMTLNNSMYYKKINTYDEYESVKNIWDNLVEMNEKDFNDNFMIILAGENYNTTGLYISDIYSKENKLFIELRKKENWDRNDTVISAKVSKELDSEQIEIINLPNDINTMDKYKNIDDITNDYNINDAISDNCFVINDRNQVVSDNKTRLNEFINNCNNKINDLIRLCIYESNRTIICDIEYTHNKINMVEKVIENNNIDTNYYTGVGITYRKRKSLDGNGYSYDYNLCNEMGKNVLICIIKE